MHVSHKKYCLYIHVWVYHFKKTIKENVNDKFQMSNMELTTFYFPFLISLTFKTFKTMQVALTLTRFLILKLLIAYSVHE